MKTLNHKLKVHPQVVDTKLDESEVVLLHLDSKTYYSLNLTGERIWQWLKDGLTPKEISRQLQEEFDVDAERATRSVHELINELSQQNLVQVLDC